MCKTVSDPNIVASSTDRLPSALLSDGLFDASVDGHER